MTDLNNDRTPGTHQIQNSEQVVAESIPQTTAEPHQVTIGPLPSAPPPDLPASARPGNESGGAVATPENKVGFQVEGGQGGEPLPATTYHGARGLAASTALGIVMAPARSCGPTDKSAVERRFRAITIRGYGIPAQDRDR
ncbi:hypothetical protein [Actinoplanes sp. NPDC026670]|uniref:hypothetical protein n=1 Tax=Actinoplanes sp. NPDC026670 TaxID=3154700 RepID=UPI0033D04AA4